MSTADAPKPARTKPRRPRYGGAPELPPTPTFAEWEAVEDGRTSPSTVRSRRRQRER